MPRLLRIEDLLSRAAARTLPENVTFPVETLTHDLPNISNENSESQLHRGLGSFTSGTGAHM